MTFVYKRKKFRQFPIDFAVSRRFCVGEWRLHFCQCFEPCCIETTACYSQTKGRDKYLPTRLVQVTWRFTEVRFHNAQLYLKEKISAGSLGQEPAVQWVGEGQVISEKHLDHKQLLIFQITPPETTRVRSKTSVYNKLISCRAACFL